MKFPSTNFQRDRIILILILLVAAFLRIWQLDKYPPSLFIDEVSNGYNAYSILKTGKDEYGNFLPLTIRAFGDYNPALSVYLLIPSIAAFGLNEFAVRFPSALLGTLTILVTFYISLKLFKNIAIALLSSFLLAISPWHLQFSRYDHEANFMLFFSILGLTLFLYGLKKHHYLIFSAVSFGCALNSYHAAKIWIPLIVAAVIVIYIRELKKIKKKVFSPIAILAISAIPIFLNIQNSLIRAQAVAIFSKEKNPVETFLDGYLSHFSPRFLFVEGDFIGRHSVNGIGQLYVFEAPLILAGLMFIFAKKDKINNKKLFLYFLLLAPIPAALAAPTPHALRAINLAPAFSILSACGIYALLKWKYRKSVKYPVLFTIFIVAVYNIITYFHLYYRHEPLLKAADWTYGYKQMIDYVSTAKKEDQTVAITSYYGKPYIFTLFFTKFDPKTFQLTGHNTEQIGNYEFFGSSWQKRNDKPAILVRPPWQIPQDPSLKILKKIQSPSQELFFVITEE